MSESERTPSMNLNHVLVLLMAARGTMNPKFIPDAEDDAIRWWQFWKRKEYNTFYGSLLFLIKNNYITPDAEEITDKGIIYIEVMLRNAAKVHMSIADYANMDDMLKAQHNLASMFTKQPQSEVFVEDDAKRGLDEDEEDY
jgi:hypothetical protein